MLHRAPRAEKKTLDTVLTESEQLLRQTYGYTTLRNNPETHQKADALLEATRTYARKWENNRGITVLADATGFSPEGVNRAIMSLKTLPHELTPREKSVRKLHGCASDQLVQGIVDKAMEIGYTDAQSWLSTPENQG